MLSPGEVDQATAVLCDAFYDYPVMRYVLGPAESDYDPRLWTLIGFFVSARIFRDEPVLGVDDDEGNLEAVALVTLPGERPSPEALRERREAVWQELGAAERSRYEAFGAAAGRLTLEDPHHHLNMIGVRRTCAGRGLARVLLRAVHNLSHADPQSCGVTLSTETSQNLPLYAHFGYRLLGHAQVSDELETWALFRPSSSAARDPTSAAESASGHPRLVPE
jgi:GNAT superfamily N-acetyltransferase